MVTGHHEHNDVIYKNEAVASSSSDGNFPLGISDKVQVWWPNPTIKMLGKFGSLSPKVCNSSLVDDHAYCMTL